MLFDIGRDISNYGARSVVDPVIQSGQTYVSDGGMVYPGVVGLGDMVDGVNQGPGNAQ